MLTLSYRPTGQRWNLARTGGATTTYNPDYASRPDYTLRLASLSHDLTGTTADLTNQFFYNPANQITQRTESNALYQYFGNNQRNGNYVPNGLNQYTQVNGQTVLYDTNGNLTSDIGQSGSGTQTFTYDMENRLVGTTGPTGTLKYDPLGRLIETAIVPGATTQFLYDGDALIGEYSISGATQTLVRRYVHGDQVDEPWVQYNNATLASAQRRYLHADHQGSIIAHSNSSGAVTAALKYDSYGLPDTANPDRFGYTGQTWISQLGLNYYKARMYSPKLGRFLQTDSIFYEDDMNMYAYVGNDPINRVDPAGTQDEPTPSTPPPVSPPPPPPPVSTSPYEADGVTLKPQEPKLTPQQKKEEAITKAITNRADYLDQKVDARNEGDEEKVKKLDHKAEREAKKLHDLEGVPDRAPLLIHLDGSVGGDLRDGDIAVPQ